MDKHILQEEFINNHCNNCDNCIQLGDNVGICIINNIKICTINNKNKKSYLQT